MYIYIYIYNVCNIYIYIYIYIYVILRPDELASVISVGVSCATGLFASIADRPTYRTGKS